ncbi:thiamine diphosphokinase [Eubacteriaceae bacterium ES2]|nr:thiamine diphosphokinase [Eubacteriaceae bacterium ES2]
MRVIIFSNGEYHDPEFYRRKLMENHGSIVIGADGGANFLKNIDVCPDYLVGDMDSISAEVLRYYEQKVTIERYPVVKDQTDTEIAIEKAIDLGADEVIIYGGTGDRIDHSLGNIYLLSRLLEKGIRGCIVNEKQEIYMIDDEIKFSYPIQTVISLLPVDGLAQAIYIDGFLYPVENGKMTIFEPYGISNMTNAEEQSIRVGSGKLLVIVNRFEA